MTCRSSYITYLYRIDSEVAKATWKLSLVLFQFVLWDSYSCVLTVKAKGAGLDTDFSLHQWVSINELPHSEVCLLFRARIYVMSSHSQWEFAMNEIQTPVPMVLLSLQDNIMMSEKANGMERKLAVLDGVRFMWHRCRNMLRGIGEGGNE